MKAFIHAIRENGSDKLGTDNAIVTNEYGSLDTMKRYAVYPFMKHHGACHLEAFYDWGNRYGKADVEIWFVNGYEIKLNSFWKKYVISHDEIGAGLAEFNMDNLVGAIDYCQRG